VIGNPGTNRVEPQYRRLGALAMAIWEKDYPNPEIGNIGPRRLTTALPFRRLPC
jgi:hypothetical protein